MNSTEEKAYRRGYTVGEIAAMEKTREAIQKLTRTNKTHPDTGVISNSTSAGYNLALYELEKELGL